MRTVYCKFFPLLPCKQMDMSEENLFLSTVFSSRVMKLLLTGRLQRPAIWKQAELFLHMPTSCWFLWVTKFGIYNFFRPQKRASYSIAQTVWNPILRKYCFAQVISLFFCFKNTIILTIISLESILYSKNCPNLSPQFWKSSKSVKLSSSREAILLYTMVFGRRYATLVSEGSVF